VQQKHRPLGITIIAILTIIGGIGFLASGIGALAFAPFLSNVNISSNMSPSAGTTTTAIPQGLLVGLSAGIGAVFIALGIAYFVMAYGLWKGKGWAWTITVILSFIGIALGIVSIVTVQNIGAIFHLIINAVVVYYLYRPHVKAFFGKATTAAPTTR
jgi:uncharacterized membrane protein (DUF2068 family)